LGPSNFPRTCSHPVYWLKQKKIITQWQESQAKGTHWQAKSCTNQDEHMQIQILSATITVADVQLTWLVA